MLYLYKSILTYGEAKEESVVHDWIIKIPLRKQGTLLSVIRGSDSYQGNDKQAKNITRMLRYIIVKESGKNPKYMSDKVVPIDTTIRVLKSRYANNRHWVEHIIGASKVIKVEYKENPYAQEYWGKVFEEMKLFTKEYWDNIHEQKRIKSLIEKYKTIYSRGWL